MALYYTLLQTRTHALVLERRFRMEGVPCELTYMPREIMMDHCNLGIRFAEKNYPEAVDILRRSGLPGCKLYRESPSADGYVYHEIYY